MKKIKVLFLINTLGNGGAERVCINLVNNMDYEKFDVHVRTMFKDGSYRSTLTDKAHYSCKNAPCPPGASKIFALIPAGILYKFFVGKEHYDIVIAYMHGAPTKVISGCKDKSIKRISWLHYGNPEKGSFFDFWLTKKMGVKAYKELDAVVGVAESVTNAFGKYTGMSSKLYTVYNTNDTSKIKQRANEKPSVELDHTVINICTAGRLSPQKGYDRLINVSKKLHDEGYEFVVSIMGTGADQASLEKQIFDLGCDSYVKLLGFQENPFSLMAQSDFYILSSREEGLATVISEAMLVGLPVVATDVSGTKEALGENSEFRIVVESSENGIYEGMKKMLDSPELLEYYKEKAIERAPFFETAKTVEQAENLFIKVINENG